MNEKTSISFLCSPGMDSFLPDIMDELEKRGHNVYRCVDNTKEKVLYAIEKSKIIWIEWAAEFFPLSNGHYLDGKRVFVRLHSYEAFSDLVKMWDWTKIEAVIFVADHVKDLMCDKQPESFIDGSMGIGNPKLVVIPNAVNVGRFKDYPHADGSKICWLGYINYKKGPQLLAEVFRRLAEIGPYTLDIGGPFQDERFRYYLNNYFDRHNISSRVKFWGTVPRETVPSWLGQFDYLLNCSVWEGDPVGVKEAMAAGTVPLVHAWPGAIKEMGAGCLVWENVTQLCSILKGIKDMTEIRKTCKLTASEYHLVHQVDAIEQLLGPPVLGVR